MVTHRSILPIDDKNTGDYGRPFGTYALIVKAKAREILIERGWTNPPERMLERMYEDHMSALPTYKEISERISRRAQARNWAHFTKEELELIEFRFQMANDPVGLDIAKKAHSQLKELGS